MASLILSGRFLLHFVYHSLYGVVGALGHIQDCVCLDVVDVLCNGSQTPHAAEKASVSYKGLHQSYSAHHNGIVRVPCGIGREWELYTN